MSKLRKSKKSHAFAAATLAACTLALSVSTAPSFATENTSEVIAPAHSESADERIAEASQNSAITGQLKREFFDPCLKRFQLQFKDVKTARMNLMKLEAGDAKKYCEKNHNEGNPALNNKVNGPAPRLATRTRTVSEFPPNFGACEMSIEATRKSFEALTVEHVANCRDTGERLTQFTTCMEGSPNAETCNTQYEAIAVQLQQINRKNSSLNDLVYNYVKKFPPLNQKAIKNYKDDVKKIEAYHARTAGSPPDPTAAERAVAENRLPIPKNGAADSIEIYTEKLGLRNPAISATTNVATTEPSLIREQEEAHELAKEFSDQLLQFKSKEEAQFRREVNTWKEKIKKLPPNSSLLGQAAPIAAPAVGAAAQFMGGGAAAAPAAATAISGASAIPALGAVAAASAVLGSTAIRKKGGSGGASESPVGGAENPADLAAPIAAANLGSDAPAAALPATPAQSPAPLAVTTDLPLSSPAKAGFGTSGSSLKNGGRIRPEGKPNAAAAPSAASDVPASFGADLRPSPRPKKDDGMGEVSSLLGQMKNLFNFDEGAGGMGGPMPLDMAMGTENPTRSIASGDDYSAPGGEYESTEENYEEVQTDTEVVVGSGVVSANGSSLFKRVHERHRICMEKGWVLHSVGGIPE